MIEYRIFYTDGSSEIRKLSTDLKHKLLSDKKVAAIISGKEAMHQANMVLRRNAKYITADGSGIIYDAQGEIIDESGKGKRKREIQERVDKGQVYQKTTSGDLIRFEYSESEKSNFEKMMFWAQGKAMVDNALIMLDRKDQITEDYFFEDKNEILLALRDFRESAAVFLFNLDQAIPFMPGSLTDEFELIRKPWMDNAGFFNQGDYDMIGGVDTRRFMNKDGEFAVCDDIGKGPKENNTTMFYPSANVLDGVQDSNDFDLYGNDALDFFCTYDSLLKAGTEAGFEEGEIFRALTQCYFDPSNEYRADEDLSLMNESGRAVGRKRFDAFMWAVVDGLSYAKKFSAEDANIPLDWEEIATINTPNEKTIAESRVIDKIYNYMEVPLMVDEIQPMWNKTEYPTMISLLNAFADNPMDTNLQGMVNDRTAQLATVAAVIVEKHKEMFPFTGKKLNGKRIDEFVLKMMSLREDGVISGKDEFVQFVSNAPAGADMSEEDNHGEMSRERSDAVAAARRSKKPIYLIDSKCADGQTCESYWRDADRHLALYLKGFEPTLARYPRKIKIDGELDGMTTRNAVELVHGDRVRKAFNTFKQSIKFKDDMTPKIIFASMLMQNGAIILKGVAGTGKTTMIECLTMLMCNPIDYMASSGMSEDENGHPDGYLNSNNTLDAIKDTVYGTVGIAKHNPDKQPDDIYYYQRIAVDTYKKADFDEWLMGQQQDSARRNPFGKGLLGSQFIREAQPQSSEEMVFDPSPRPVVTHPIKFHNEGNRMNKRVADATLGLLAEQEMEYQGKTFRSPAQGVGAFTLLDYNPHIDWMPDGEMDRALLDRFDCSVFIPALNLANKVSLLSSAAAKGNSPKKMVQTAINQFVMDNKMGVDPISYEELCEIWRDVNAVTVPRQALYLAGCYSNTFSMTFRKYAFGADNFYEDQVEVFDPAIIKDDPKVVSAKGGKPSDAQTKATIAPFMDSSMENFGFGDAEDVTDFFSTKGLESFDVIQNKYGADAVKGDNPGGVIARLMQNYRPLGYRNADSLVRLSKAFTWLEAALNEDDSGSKDGLLASASTMKMLLPYVISHRLNLGVGEQVKKTYSNIEDWINNDVVPKYIDISEKMWLDLYNNVARTLFIKNAADNSNGLAYDAAKGKKVISKQTFYERYDAMMLSTGYLADSASYWTSIAADPISSETREYAYEMAKDMSFGPCLWDEKKKDFVFPGGFAYNPKGELVWVD